MINLFSLEVSLKGEVKRSNWFYVWFFFCTQRIPFHCPCMSQGIAFDKNLHGNLWNCVMVCSDLAVLVYIPRATVSKVLSSQEHEITQEAWTSPYHHSDSMCFRPFHDKWHSNVLFFSRSTKIFLSRWSEIFIEKPCNLILFDNFTSWFFSEDSVFIGIESFGDNKISLKRTFS